MAQLFAAGCSVISTRRRRFLWAAWWSGPPTHVPFRKPDASEGGAASPEEALAEAERRAGLRLIFLDPLWARAWNRILRGEDPWPSAASRLPRSAHPGARPADPEAAGPEAAAGPAGAPPGEAPGSVWATLGVSRSVTPDELKAAYRRKVREAHPDQGGDAASFQRVLQAYEEAARRLRRPRPRG